MDGIERLKDSMARVKALVGFYQHSPFVTLHGIDAAGRDVLDTTTNVTVEDLETLLNGLADRDISLRKPELKTQREMGRDAKLAKAIVDEREIWAREYEKGYKAGRDGEVKRIRELIERCITNG